MSILKVLLKVARKVGPVAAMAVIRYGPQLRKLVADNPEVVEKITQRFKKVDSAKQHGTLEQRVQVLRDQVTYLYASANTSEVARQAAEWRKELEALQQAIPLLQAMSSRQKMTERRRITQRIDLLSAQILEASLVDSIEDAEIVGGSDPDRHADDTGNGTEAPGADDGQKDADPSAGPSTTS
ncbi:MAG: hypothetical protein Q3979_04275 [Actinomycetaceae bacterium]|nr:hypothetical protein [Actinomycetaceae bacterium]